jgi:site-specific recombinase XerC
MQPKRKAPVKLPKFVERVKRRDGTYDHYFRRRYSDGSPSYRCSLPDPSHPSFAKEYGTALRESDPTTAAHPTVRDAYVVLQKTPEWLAHRQSTRTYHKRVLDKFVDEHGHRPIGGLRRATVETLLAGYADRPEAGNVLLTLLRALCAAAMAQGWIDTNPTAGIKKTRRPTDDDGRPPWEHAWIEQWREFYPLGTLDRLILELSFCTGHRASDLIKLGAACLESRNDLIGWALRQHKTRQPHWVPMSQEAHDAIAASGVAEAPVYLTTRFGVPFTASGIMQRVRNSRRAAKLPEAATLHGLRRRVGTDLADRDAGEFAVGAALGHRGTGQAKFYTRHRDRAELVVQAAKRRGLALVNAHNVGNQPSGGTCQTAPFSTTIEENSLVSPTMRSPIESA